ncbi:hypothetical protein [Aliiglaciecola lipolytica]|uniref:Uncharacterized protein n=1 Tax=Aliiglaciecola lipolytica E3 TaxID=1127673 RepID=K6Y8G0_9ALTE|nr:hypothetical protein [Aliiglaciecola lipolytica]GAC14492.1 hypothetical protein GLIP_1864 [Aliiglaciecola lipolytica E3]
MNEVSFQCKVNQLFDDGYAVKQRKSVVSHCAYLSYFANEIKSFDFSFSDNAFEELRQQFSQEQVRLLREPGLYDLIKANKKIGAFPFYSFIISISKVKRDYLEAALSLQLNVLVAAYELKKLKGYEDYIERAFDATRIIFTDNKYQPIIGLIEPYKTYTEKDFLEIREQSKLAPHHLTRLASLFDKYSARMPTISKRIRVDQPKEIPPDKKPNYTNKESLVPFEDDEPKYTEILATEGNVTTSNGDHLEKIIDEKTATRYFEFLLIAPDEVKKSARLKSQLANSVAANIERREKSLTTEFRFLTKHEVTILVKECMHNIDDTYFGLLLLSLITGRTISEFLDNEVVMTKAETGELSDHYVIRYKPSLPNYEMIKKAITLIKKPKGEVLLIIPKCMNNLIANITRLDLAIDSTKQAISDCISQMNKRYCTRFTLAKISSVMPFYLIKAGADAAEIALMKGSSVVQHAACYYYQVPVQKLIELHQDFLSYLDADNNYGLSDFKKKTDLTVGSALQLQEDTAKKLFAVLHAKLLEQLQMGWENIEVLHNYLTVYTLFILNLSTGHRPVKHPYHTIDAFDLETSTVFIADKESRSNSAGRVLKLPSLAKEQLNHYLTHLRHIHHYFAQLSYQDGKHITDTLLGELPLFSFIQDSRFLTITPKLLDDFCIDLLPIPLNWHRHFIRTWLRDNNAKPLAVDVFMGHVNGDGDPFSRYSGVSMKDLDEVARLLNQLLSKNLEIKPFSSIEGLRL